MFGSRTPVTRSISRSTDVWSKTCELVQPPRDQGETTHSGTRLPSPIGWPSANSPGVPAGAVGGTTWSK